MALRKIPASCITCWQGFHASLPTTSTAQCGGQPSKHKASHRVAAVFIYKNTITAGGSDCGCCVVQEQIIGLHPALWLSACSCNDVTENRSHICIFFLWYSNLLIMITDYTHMWWTVLEERGNFFPRLCGASLKSVRKVTFTKVRFTEKIIHVTPFKLWVLSLKILLSVNFFITIFELSKNVLKIEN